MGRQNSVWIRGNAIGGNRKEISGKEVEVVWACDAKRGELRKKGDVKEEDRKAQMHGWTN